MLGVTYKRDIEDVRESPALDIIKILEGKGARVSYNDPYVPELHLDRQSGRHALRRTCSRPCAPPTSW